MNEIGQKETLKPTKKAQFCAWHKIDAHMHYSHWVYAYNNLVLLTSNITSSTYDTHFSGTDWVH